MYATSSQQYAWTPDSIQWLADHTYASFAQPLAALTKCWFWTLSTPMLTN